MEQEEGITLGELLQMIQKHIVSAIVVCVVVFAAVAAYTFLAPKKYEATAELLAISGQGAISDNANASQYSSIGSYINTQIATYPQLVKTETVLEPVIDDLGLDTTVAETAELITASNPGRDLHGGHHRRDRGSRALPAARQRRGGQPERAGLDLDEHRHRGSGPGVAVRRAAGRAAGGTELAECAFVSRRRSGGRRHPGHRLRDCS